MGQLSFPIFHVPKHLAYLHDQNAKFETPEFLSSLKTCKGNVLQSLLGKKQAEKYIIAVDTFDVKGCFVFPDDARTAHKTLSGRFGCSPLTGSTMEKPIFSFVALDNQDIRGTMTVDCSTGEIQLDAETPGLYIVSFDILHVNGGTMNPVVGLDLFRIRNDVYLPIMQEINFQHSLLKRRHKLFARQTDCEKKAADDVFKKTKMPLFLPLAKFLFSRKEYDELVDRILISKRSEIYAKYNELTNKRLEWEGMMRGLEKLDEVIREMLFVTDDICKKMDYSEIDRPMGLAYTEFD